MRIESILVEYWRNFKWFGRGLNRLFGRFIDYLVDFYSKHIWFLLSLFTVNPVTIVADPYTHTSWDQIPHGMVVRSYTSHPGVGQWRDLFSKWNSLSEVEGDDFCPPILSLVRGTHLTHTHTHTPSPSPPTVCMCIMLFMCTPCTTLDVYKLHGDQHCPATVDVFLASGTENGGWAVHQDPLEKAWHVILQERRDSFT